MTEDDRDKGKTKMRGPDEILMDVVSKSQGDVTKISDLMKNQVSRAAAIWWSTSARSSTGASRCSSCRACTATSRPPSGSSTWN